MNPETNKFERVLTKEEKEAELALRRRFDVQWAGGTLEPKDKPPGLQLYRENGEPVPPHWTIMREGENVVVKNYTFKVVRLGEAYLVLEPVGPVTIGKK